MNDTSDTAKLRRLLASRARLVDCYARDVLERQLLEALPVLIDELDQRRDDFVRGMKIANELTPETQTVEEACAELARLVRRAEADQLRVVLRHALDGRAHGEDEG